MCVCVCMCCIKTNVPLPNLFTTVYVTPDLLVEDVDLLNLLFAGDNVDHNIITINGKITFHRIGMIVVLTPGRKTSHLVSQQNISEQSIVEIIEYCFATHVFETSHFKNFLDSIVISYGNFHSISINQLRIGRA